VGQGDLEIHGVRGERPGQDETQQHISKESGMKHGHVTGTKREKKGASDWYKQIEEENIRKVEAAWQAQQQALRWR
jgi:hypothetical protein